MLNKLTDRVYYMDFVQQGDRPVLGLIVGDKCSLVVDGGNGKAHAEEFLSYVEKLNIPKIKYLVLTHWHWDHVFGITTIDAINIVNKRSNEKLKWMKELSWSDKAIRERVLTGEEIEFCEEHIKIEHPNNDRNFEIPSADIIFDDEILIDLGGVKVKVERVNVDHASDSCLVTAVEEKVTFMGDSMYLDMYHGEWSYSREKLYPYLEKLFKINSNFYIPAHHPLYNKEDFIKFTKHIKEIGDIVGNSTDIEQCTLLLKEARGSELSEWDIEDIRGFVSHNKKLKKLV
ncbi:MAG: MBL fold metallo-hydrolase [Clostridium sp.]|uniref:MBL fold metallo-hydrolase n=1 Tax=Clostridium sp. TaxID=1506 RepID=UPI003F4053EE